LLVKNKFLFSSIELSPALRVRVVSGKFLRFIKAFFVAIKIIRERNISVITTQDIDHAPIGWVMSLVFKIPWQMQIHTDILSPYFYGHSALNKFRVFLARFFLSRADQIRVVSNRTKQLIVSELPKIKASVVVLPIYLDLKKIHDAPINMDLHNKYPGYDFIILMASRLTKEKNIPLAIDAMSKVLSPNTAKNNPLLLIVGEGSERKTIASKIESSGLKENIKMEDWVLDLSSYYKTADLFLLTSNYEGGARAPLEALASGLPVCMTDVPPAREVVIDGVNGCVVPVKDSKALAERIKRLILNKGELAGLKERAPDILKNVISKEKYLEEFKKTFTNLTPGV